MASPSVQDGVTVSGIDRPTSCFGCCQENTISCTWIMTYLGMYVKPACDLDCTLH